MKWLVTNRAALYQYTRLIGKLFFFSSKIVFALGGSPTSHPISSRPHFVCKFSRHGSSSLVASHLAPRRLLKVPKCEIFDRSDFHEFYTIKLFWVGDFGVKYELKIT